MQVTSYACGQSRLGITATFLIERLRQAEYFKRYWLSSPVLLVSEVLFGGRHTIENITIQTEEQLVEIDEIGGKIAESVVEWFSKDEHLELIQSLKSKGLQFAINEEQLEGQTDKLAGLNIIISGTFEKHSRDELKKLIEKHGGKNVGSISKKTSYMLAGNNIGPSKLEKVDKLGIPMISEDDFFHGRDQLQELTGRYTDMVDKIQERKEKEIKEI